MDSGEWLMVEVYADRDALAEAAAGFFAESARQAVAERGRCTVALAGGRTPVPLYRRLGRGSEEHRMDIPWDRIHLFWGDERWVPVSHEDSNFRVVESELLTRAPVPPGNVHPMDTAVDAPAETARRYEERLREFFRTPGDESRTPPRLDLVLLGLGEDGHTASLFPGCEAVEERSRWVAVCDLDRLEHPRVTLTLPVLERARRVLFLVSGEEKAEILRRVLEARGERRSELPAARLELEDGEVSWLVDRAAAGDPGGGSKRREAQRDERLGGEGEA